MQLPLFDSIAPTRREARRQALEAAHKRGAAGAKLAADKAGAEWVALATEKLRMFARTCGGVFNIELARVALEQAGELPAPTDARARGVVTVRAKSAQYIVRVPRGDLPAASSNGNVKPGYRRGPLA